MQNEFSQVNCFIDSVNTGFGRCVPKPGKLEYTIVVPKGTRITRTNLASILAYFTTACKNDLPQSRFYPLPKWVKVEDKSTDPVTEGFDGGVETTLFDGATIWVRRTVSGGLCAHFALRNLCGAQEQYEFLEVFKSTDKSATYYIAGRRVYNSTTGEYELAGFTYDDCWTPTWKIAAGSTSAQYMFKTVMGNTDQMNKDFMFIPITFQIDDLPRIQDVNVSAVKASTGNFDVLATLACSGQNLNDVYDNLDDPDAWICLNDLGNEVDIPGVTIVNGKYRIALDTGTPDADYTAGTSFKFSLRPISVTSAAPFLVQYIESQYSALVAK